MEAQSCPYNYIHFNETLFLLIKIWDINNLDFRHNNHICVNQSGVILRKVFKGMSVFKHQTKIRFTDLIDSKRDYNLILSCIFPLKLNERNH